MGVERSIGSTYGPKMVGSNLIREIVERAIKNGTIIYLKTASGTYLFV